MLSLKDGFELVKLARSSIESVFENKKVDTPPLKKYSKKRGVFVTLHIFSNNELRGCIGLVQPDLSLGRAIVEAAKSAAFSDPRFAPLQKDELGDIIVEISVLTEPMEIKIEGKREDILKEIKIGKDGLIVSCLGYSGLLLPQVATEQKWNALEFLEYTCLKAGLEKDAWKQKNCRVSKFQAQIFSETKPKGKVIDKTC